MKEQFDTDFIQESIESTPYTDEATSTMLREWCGIHDSMAPIFISRENWEEVDDIFQKVNNADGSTRHFLYLPKDLNLWEMVEIANVVDKDTYKDNPEIPVKRVEKRNELASTFQKAGVYINENVKHVEEGKELAEEMSKKFFNYGISLQSRTKKEEENIGGVILSEEDRKKLDEWFLGPERYKKVMERLGNDTDQSLLEQERKRHFRGYFKALSSKGYRSSKVQPFIKQVGPIQQIHESSQKGIERAIKTPQRELESSIFDRGVYKLIKNIKVPGWQGNLTEFLEDKWNLDLLKEETRLYTYLEIPKLKEDLESVRATGNISAISSKELEIARKIQEAVSKYPYETAINNPSDILKNRRLNCVGASVLGGSLLNELGINYLLVDLPKHSTTILSTTDGKLYWQDFTPSSEPLSWNYKRITYNMLQDPISLYEFARKPTDKGIEVIFPHWNPYSIVVQPMRCNLYKPEIGLPTHILMNLGSEFFFTQNNYHMAISTFKKLTEINPNHTQALKIMGDLYYEIGEYQEAESSYNEFLVRDGRDIEAYYRLGYTLDKLGKEEEAILALTDFIWLWEGERNIKSEAERMIQHIKSKLVISTEPTLGP